MKTLNETKTKELTVSQIASELYHSKKTILDWSQAMKLAWTMKKVESENQVRLEDYFNINNNPAVKDYIVEGTAQENENELISSLAAILWNRTWLFKENYKELVVKSFLDIFEGYEFTFSIEEIQQIINEYQNRPRIYSYKNGEKAIYKNNEKYILNKNSLEYKVLTGIENN
jgi:hypothetical protein